MLYCFKLTTLVMVLWPGLTPFQQKFSPRKEALALFNKYQPVIERKNNAIVDTPNAIVGDINGDGKEDCIVSFVMTSRDGGNAIIGHESIIYLNMGTGMKVAGAFPAYKFCYRIGHIKDQVIYAKEYECKPPYNTVLGEKKFNYTKGEIKIID
jgi:hypothetical protein